MFYTIGSWLLIYLMVSCINCMILYWLLGDKWQINTIIIMLFSAPLLTIAGVVWGLYDRIKGGKNNGY